MVTGTVVASIWSTRRLEELPNGALLEVELEGSGAHVVALDVLGSGVGERVLVTCGAAAAGWFLDEHVPVDALVVGSIDESNGAGTAAAAAAPANDEEV
jgi:ethanolamine utilization protein EutN